MKHSSGLSQCMGSFGLATVSWLQKFVSLFLHIGPGIWASAQLTALGFCSISGSQRYSTCLLHKYMVYKYTHATAAVKSLQSCLTLYDPIDSSPPGSPSLGFSRQEHWSGVAISFSNAWKWKVKVKLLSCVWLFVTPWTVAYQAPLFMGFSSQEYWSGLPFSSPKHTHTHTHTHNCFV